MSVHEEWTDRLSDYLDDELPRDERQAIERHLEGCATCAATLAELRRVVEAASSLEPAPPGDHVWQGVAARVRELPPARQSITSRRFAFSLPQLVAASLLLALLSGWGALRLVIPRGSMRPAVPIETQSSVDRPNAHLSAVSVSDRQYDAAVDDLEQALQRGRGRLDPATVTTVEDDLRIIDAALQEARQALIADPGNGYLSQHVADTRQQKLDLLRRAAAMTTDSQM